MTFRTFNRRLFAKLESTGGTYASPAAADFIEANDIQVSVTPMTFERMAKHQTLTNPVPIVPGASKSSPIAEVELTFSVELAGPGTGVAAGTAPQIGRLLQGCGMEELDEVYALGADTSTLERRGASYTRPLYARESVDFGATYAAAECYMFDDGTLNATDYYVTPVTPGSAPNAATASITTANTASDNQCTLNATGALSRVGVGYRFNSAYTDSSQANSSLSFTVYLDDAGAGSTQNYQIKGARGTVEFAFTHGDRVMANFTFSGVLKAYNETGTVPANYQYAQQTPPPFINVGLAIGSTLSTANNWSGALFNSMSVSLGNETTARTDSNDAVGMSDAVITGRSPQMTFNPDAVASSGNFDFWNAMLSGDQLRLEWTVGTAAGNKILFRIPAAVFTGVGDADRDEVQILDGTLALTGGGYGSSIHDEGDTKGTSTELGHDNEVSILFL